MARALHPDHLRRPWAVWCAVLLAVLFAMAPTLTHALADTGTGSSLEICTAQGTRTLAPDNPYSADSSTGQESEAPFQHCPFCLHQADRLAPPLSPLPYLFAAQSGPQVIPAWQVFFFSDSSSLWAPARGPPATAIAL